MSELEKKGDEQLNHLLSMSLDVESLFFLVQKEEDTDTKQVHFYLFKVTRANDMKKQFDSMFNIFIGWNSRN